MKSLLSLVLLCLTALLAIAEPTHKQLIGHWRYADERHTVEFSFHEDGTFSGHLTQEAKVVWTYAGNWSLAGDILDYEYTQSSVERIPVGTKDRDKLLEITKEHYLIEARDGSRRKYSRVLKPLNPRRL